MDGCDRRLWWDAGGTGALTTTTITRARALLLVDSSMAAGFRLPLLAALVACGALGASAQSLCPLDCPFGFACISSSVAPEGAVCLPLNPCDIAECGEGFFCDLLFTEDQCNPSDSQSECEG